LEFVFLDTAILCSGNYQKKLQREADAGCYQRCEIRTVNSRIRKRQQNCRIYNPALHERRDQKHTSAWSRSLIYSRPRTI